MNDTIHLVRGTVTLAKGDKGLRRFQIHMKGDIARDDIEHLEPYGFTSEPFLDEIPDALMVFFDGNYQHGSVITVADERYRILNMKQGEVAIYDDKGRHVYLKREGIEIDGVSSPITVKTSGKVTINAAGNCEITAPTVTINGNVKLNGTMTATGDVIGKGVSLSGHTHTGDSGGSTSTPH